MTTAPPPDWPHTPGHWERMPWPARQAWRNRHLRPTPPPPTAEPRGTYHAVTDHMRLKALDLIAAHGPGRAAKIVGITPNSLKRIAAGTSDRVITRIAKSLEEAT